MKITQNIPPGYYRTFHRHHRIGHLLHRVPVADFLIRRIGAAAASLTDDVRRIEVRTTNDGYGYTAPYGDLRAALTYAAQIAEPNFGPDQVGESWRLYQEQLATLRPLLRPGTTLFNFGVCYAHIDAILARERPDCRFVGIDLSPHVAAFNAVEFGDVHNLSVLHGDVFDHLATNTYPGGVFLHSRTLVLLPRPFIERLYTAVRMAGFAQIVGFEQGGLSEETETPYTFGPDDRPSAYWRDRMFLHNYPGLAVRAGFAIREMRLFTTKHGSADFQVLAFVAERITARSSPRS